MHANIGMENFGVEYYLRRMQWIIYRQSYFHLEVSSFVGSFALSCILKPKPCKVTKK